MYDRNSRVIGVSNMRWLQIWLKNFYRWSRKWSRCEENKWGVKDNTNTRSILNLYQNILDSTFNLSSIRKKNDKVIKANLSKNVWIWKCAFHLSVMKIWASSWKSNQGSNKEYGTEPMIGIQCKKMINEHIPKYRVSDNKVKRCVEPRNENENPYGENMLNSSSKKT